MTNGAPERLENGLAEAIGLGGGMVPTGFPQNQGSPYSEQISQPTTIFRNLRWYLISNMRQVLSEAYAEIGLVAAICDLPVDDALRGGVEIKSGELNEKQIATLITAIDRNNDLVVAGQAAKWNRLYGGSGIIIMTDQDPEVPFDPKAIQNDTPLEFRAVDMWELFGGALNVENFDLVVADDDESLYNYYGEMVHSSRVMRMRGIEAPSFIRPRLRGWGLSVVEILVRSINQYLKATDLAFEVLDEFKVDIFKIKNLTNSLMSPQGEQAIRRRVQIANYQKNYQNALTMDAEDDWDHKQLSFAGLGDAMLQIRMQVASDMRMPLTKLFGISAAGFNSGEDDIEVYNAMVESQVRNKLKYDLLRMIEIRCQKEFGFIPTDLSIAFKPLRVMSAEQEENVKTQKFTRLSTALSSGQIDQKTFRDACNKENLLGITIEEPDEGDLSAGAGAAKLGAEAADGEGAGPPAPGGEAPKVKTKQAPQAKTQNAKFDESKHPRADDGKFGEGGGSGKEPADKEGAKPKADTPKASLAELKKSGAKWAKHAAEGDLVEVRIKPSDNEPAKTLYGTVDRISLSAAADGDPDKAGYAITTGDDEGPRYSGTWSIGKGSSSVKILSVIKKKKNAEGPCKNKDCPSYGQSHPNCKCYQNEMYNSAPERFTRLERTMRLLLNSADFDRASYEADGGDDWIDSRRRELFDDAKAEDPALWREATERSKAALGEVRWQFVVFMYMKLGGSFS